MAEVMNKEKAIRFHPVGYLLQEILVVFHMLQKAEMKSSKNYNKHHISQLARQMSYTSNISMENIRSQDPSISNVLISATITSTFCRPSFLHKDDFLWLFQRWHDGCLGNGSKLVIFSPSQNGSSFSLGQNSQARVGLICKDLLYFIFYFLSN